MTAFKLVPVLTKLPINHPVVLATVSTIAVSAAAYAAVRQLRPFVRTSSVGNQEGQAVSEILRAGHEANVDHMEVIVGKQTELVWSQGSKTRKAKPSAATGCKADNQVQIHVHYQNASGST